MNGNDEDEEINNNQHPTIILKEHTPATVLLRVRGGAGGSSSSSSSSSSSFLELNPNYNHHGDHSKNRGFSFNSDTGTFFEREFNQYHDSINSPIYYQEQHEPLRPLSQVAMDFFQKLHRSSPALYYGTVSSIVTFFLWQFPPLMPILQNHFVCSQYNLSKRRYHTLLTSVVSHSTFSHLFMNLYGYLTFGKSIQPLLQINQISLGMFCITAGIFSNAFFVRWNPHGSCIGLSGVALSLFAMDAKLHPSKEIAFLVKFLPIRLPAQYALTALWIWSLVGMMSQGRDGVAHAAHLGGILFGMVAYECLQRGIWMQWKRTLYGILRQGSSNSRSRRWKQVRNRNVKKL
jgi:membrane associated rhomboid family serine protease